VFYVYSPKERSSLRRLGRKYGLAEDIFERYVALEFDLYQDLVVEYSDWPTYTYGIKQIAKLTGFSWRDVDPSGTNSIAWYNDYLTLAGKERATVLKRTLEYNEDDCRAMAHIKDWFVANR
jgi:predicted RecB family nuclease